MIDRHVFKCWAEEAGFTEVGFCGIEDFRDELKIVEQQEKLSERRQLRFSPEEEYPQAKSLAVLLWPYLPAAYKGDSLYIDSYYEASNAAYHAARVLESLLNQNGVFAKANVSYPAKAAAIRAGLGVIGKNSLLITPKYGTRVVIILMATGIPIHDDDMPKRLHASCRNCGRCALVCPAKALDEQGMSHPERCLRNYMLEGRSIPNEYRAKIGMRFLGCDMCQRVCPMQPMLPEEQGQECFRLDGFVTDDEAHFSQNVERLTKKIGKNTARPQRVRAQAAILAGNSRDPQYLPVLRKWTYSDFEAVRTHAQWAICQIEQNAADAVRT